MSEKLEIPRFASEAEEAEWWFNHRDETAALLETAVAAGKTTSLEALVEKQRSGPTPTVSIRIDPDDLARARVQARRRGLRYQTYLKMVLHEALEREDQRIAS